MTARPSAQDGALRTQNGLRAGATLTPIPGSWAAVTQPGDGRSRCQRGRAVVPWLQSWGEGPRHCDPPLSTRRGVGASTQCVAPTTFRLPNTDPPCTLLCVLMDSIV